MKYAKQIKECKNMGQLFEIALTTSESDAKEFFNDYVDFVMFENQNAVRADAEKIVHSNLGYFAGYYSDEVREKIYRLFGSEHPVFGTSHPTMEEAFSTGKKLAKTPNP